MAATTAALYGKKVLVLEKMPRPARKIMITGKGRCNLTNNTDLNGLIANTCRNGRFLYSAFSRFGAEDTIAFFERAGVPLKTERGNRVFPVSDKSVDIVDGLVNSAKKAGVKILNKEVEDIITLDGAVSAVNAPTEPALNVKVCLLQRVENPTPQQALRVTAIPLPKSLVTP